MSQNSEVCTNSILEQSLPDIWKDIIKYSPSKIVGMLINLFLVPIYTNLLLPEEYGLYNVAIAALSFLCIIFSDWVGISGLRFFKEHDKNNNITSYFSTLFFLLSSNLILMYIFGFIFFKPVADYFKLPSNLLYLVLLLIIPVAIRALLFQVLRAQIKPTAYTISVILNQLTTVGFAVYFIKVWHLGPTAILLGMAFSIVLIDFLMLFLSKMTNSLEIEGIKFNILNNFYRYGVPIAVSSLGIWIITQSNKFILQYFKGSYYNGLCGVGLNLTFGIILPLLAIITLAAVPRIYNKFEEGVDVRPIISKLTGYYFIIFAPIIIVLCLFPRELVMLFSHRNYADAYILIPFLALSIFAFGLTEYTTLQYHLSKKTYLDTIIRLIPGLIGILLSIALIPKYNIIGVGISTFITNFFYLILSLVIRVKDLSWQPPYQEIIRTLISILVTLIVFVILRGAIYPNASLNFGLQVFIIVFIYVGSFKLQTKIKDLLVKN